ncbi:MAG: hypothetical protein ACRETZ_00625 [Steroidobacteraceae bacterium]
MSNEQKRPDMRFLWQSQMVESTSMSLDELVARFSKLTRTVRLRTWTLGPLCLILIASFGAQIFRTPNHPITHITACLAVIGAGYLFYRVILGRPRASGQSLSEGEPEACAAFYRSELERQRDLHRRTAVWFPLVFLGPVLVFLFQIRQVTTRPFTVTMVAISAGLFGIFVVADLWRAREYQHELNKLNANSGELLG